MRYLHAHSLTPPELPICQRATNATYHLRARVQRMYTSLDSSQTPKRLSPPLLTHFAPCLLPSPQGWCSPHFIFL